MNGFKQRKNWFKSVHELFDQIQQNRLNSYERFKRDNIIEIKNNLE